MCETKMAFRFLNAHADRSIEWLSALMMIGWAIVLAQPGNIFTFSPMFGDFVRDQFTETRLALIFGCVGVGRAIALYVNGRWPKSPIFRMIGSGIGSLLWGQIATIQAISIFYTGNWTTGIVMYGLLSLAEIACVYRAAFDVRYHRS